MALGVEQDRRELPKCAGQSRSLGWRRLLSLPVPLPMPHALAMETCVWVKPAQELNGQLLPRNKI